MIGSVSCSKSYLDTKPSDSGSDKAIFENTDGYKMGMNGVYRLMTRQYSAFGQGWNGEGTIKYYIGNFGGNNFLLANSGNTASNNQTYHDNNTSTFVLYPWYYYYALIGNINSLIDGAESVPGNQAIVKNVKAQALTVRAYSYMMLSQLFHKRWIDGKQDEAVNGNGLVLRLQPTLDSQGLASAAETYNQIYADLEEAIKLFEESNVKRSNNFEANINTAYAVYARAALIKRDYAKAAEYAAKAREGYPLMSEKEYISGFNTPNSEWIWSTTGTMTETIYYYSFFAYMGYNSNTSTIRTYPRCIYRPLYEQIPATDIRKNMFLNAKDGEFSSTTGFDTKDSILFKRVESMKITLPENAKVAAFMQFKFKSLDELSVGHLNHFRSSEMYLIEAEARYFLKDEAAAQKLLVELNATSKRDPSYTCTATGEDLFNEIKLYRSIELWGEGFEFFDLKRWGDKIDRKGFKDGGNWKSSYVVTVKPDQYNAWTNVLPTREVDYNDLLK
jgi:SusD family.